MSRDYNVTTKPCPCGKGLVKETYGSNDWNQTSYQREMLCQECIEKENKEKVLKEERYNIAIKKTEKAVSYFREKYFNEFKDRFAKANNKKTIWTIACDLGAEYSSLSKFYNYFKSKDEYIENLISWSNLKKVIKNMGINDVVLNNLYEDAYIHKKPFDDEFNARAYRSAKGK